MLRQWKRGLLWMPVVYLVGMGAYLGMLKYAGDSRAIFDEIAKLDEESPDEGKLRNLKNLQQINDKLGDALGRLQKARTGTTIMSSVLVAVALLYLWCTWQLTSGPDGRWEIWARRIIFVVPLLFLMPLLGVQGALFKLLSKGLSVVLALGHEEAYQKIGVHTGNRDLAVRIYNIYRIFWIVLLGSIMVMIVLDGRFQNFNIETWAVNAIYAAGILCILALSYTLSQMHARVCEFERRRLEG